MAIKDTNVYCVVCMWPLGSTLKICTVCTDYLFCWECFFAQQTILDHSVDHPVETVPYSIIAPNNTAQVQYEYEESLVEEAEEVEALNDHYESDNNNNEGDDNDDWQAELDKQDDNGFNEYNDLKQPDMQFHESFTPPSTELTLEELTAFMVYFGIDSDSD